MCHPWFEDRQDSWVARSEISRRILEVQKIVGRFFQANGNPALATSRCFSRLEGMPKTRDTLTAMFAAATVAGIAYADARFDNEATDAAREVTEKAAPLVVTTSVAPATSTMLQHPHDPAVETSIYQDWWERLAGKQVEQRLESSGVSPVIWKIWTSVKS